MSATDTLGRRPRHPAKYSDSILDAFVGLWPHLADLLGEPEHGTRYKLLDPFAGTGRVHELMDRLPVQTTGVELEPEWAGYSEHTIVGDATDLPAEWAWLYDLVFTSPVYGNRMSDHHDAKDDSSRITYKHTLGRDLSPGSAAVLHFPSKAYIALHNAAWRAAVGAVKPGGLVVLNVSNFLEMGDEKRCVEFHLNALLMLGCFMEMVVPVETPRMGFGAGADARCRFERIIVVRTPDDPQPRML